MSKMSISRRRFLALGLGTTAACGWNSLSLAAPVQSAPVTLTPKQGKAELLGKGLPKTTVWSYNQKIPGPVLRLKQGEEVNLFLKNALQQPTTIHWHGIRIDNRMDGVANLTQKPVASGAGFHYRFKVPDAGTFWYHPHNRSWEQMARGLYGLLIVEEPNAPDVDRDLALVLDDWYLKADGRFDEASLGNLGEWAHDGRTGNVLTINGKPDERLVVHRGERIRLRLANTANSRILQMRLEGTDAYTIAVDGQPLKAPRALNKGRIILPPAGRMDLIVDVSGKAGDLITLSEVSSLRQPLLWLTTSTKTYQTPASRPAYITLPSNNIPEPDLKNAARFDLDMSGGAMGGLRSAKFNGEELSLQELVSKHKMIWAFNGVADMPKKPFFNVFKGQTVIVNIINSFYPCRF